MTSWIFSAQECPLPSLRGKKRWNPFFSNSSLALFVPCPPPPQAPALSYCFLFFFPSVCVTSTRDTFVTQKLDMTSWVKAYWIEVLLLILLLLAFFSGANIIVMKNRLVMQMSQLRGHVVQQVKKYTSLIRGKMFSYLLHPNPGQILTQKAIGKRDKPKAM